jgi:hypothetical protein
MSFADMKSRGRNDLSKLQGELNKLNTPQTKENDDDRFWQPEVDKAGNGYAVIRFLPASEGEDVPFVRIWDHGFKGPGGWFIEKSLTTIGQNCPVSEYNSTLWNSGSDADKQFVRQNTKRRLYFLSNIYIVKDPANPQNEGQVKLYRYGKKIFDKINEAMNPAFEDEQAINPFDFWQGADFKLKIRKVEGYRNYDKSEFDAQSTLGGFDDDELEAIWSKENSLQEFIDPKHFKSYDELKAKLNKALGLTGAVAATSTAASHDEAPAPSFREQVATPTPQKVEDDIPWDTGSATEEDDDSLSFFKQLAEED